ncbi:CWC16 protein [Pseudoneurospora amorphoporcata]|uniref:Splicing factor YJU2 n=1 Tax=Pseudoneurospora amorphoporcata TaxID=241081 RepID=A0AAN6SIA1_9PEZI|nr:CWC16 protein [Pseudoneurospora amorphoporcata]
MSERKVLTKYYPPDFDPSLVGRSRQPKQSGPKVQTVRLMAPFSLRCSSCGEYMYKGRKFNARKETPVDERYLNIQIYRFYIRCTRCSAEIVFRTDPKNQDYAVEKGAKRNTEPWRRGLEGELDETDEQRLDRIEREMADENGEVAAAEERNAMAELEQKTADAKREMAVADALDEIRSRNARLEKAQRDGGVDIECVLGGRGLSEEEERRRREEEEDAEAARKAFEFARLQQKLEEGPAEEEVLSLPGVPGATAATNGEESSGSSSSAAAAGSLTTSAASVSNPTTAAATDMPPPSFKRQVKKKKDHSALLGIKKKQPLV